MKCINCSVFALSITLLVLGSSLDGNAQFPTSRRSAGGSTVAKYLSMRQTGEGNLKPFQRYEVGYTFLSANGTMLHSHLTPFDDVDTSFDCEVKGKAWGIAYGTYFPLAAISEKSLLTFYLGLNVNIYRWRADSLFFAEKAPRSTYVYKDDGFGFLVGLPIGLDYKTGGEATLDKSDKFSFTAGGGIMPTAAVGGLSYWGQAKIKLIPYIKAEIGMHAGIEWKVRAMYMLRSPMGFTDINHDLEGILQSQAEFQTNDRLMISVLLMPFSWDWVRSKWWN